MLGAILGGASLLGSLFGGGAKASAEGRRNDALIQGQLNAQNNRAQLDAAGHNLQAPSLLGRRAIGASGLMHFAPKGDHPAARGAAEALQDPQIREAILQRLIDDSGQQLRSRSYMVRPQMAQMQKSGFLEKLGGLAGLAGGLAGGLKEAGLFGGQKPPLAARPLPTNYAGLA